MAATLRENLLVTMGMYAGEMDHADTIHIPSGVAGEDELADFCVECVDNFINHVDDIPFDEYAEQCLLQKFKKEDDVMSKILNAITTDDLTYHVLACAGRIEKVLMTGTYNECRFFCDDHDWEWSEEPDGFVWELMLEVEEI